MDRVYMIKPPYGGTGMVFDVRGDAEDVAAALYGEDMAEGVVVDVPMVSTMADFESVLGALDALFEKREGASGDGGDPVRDDE